MAVNDNQHSKPYTEAHIANMSFDPEFQVQVVELLGYDPLGSSGNGAMKRITTNALGEYAVNDIEEVGAVTYIGKEDAAGDWFVQKIDTSSGQSFRYATLKNNGSETSYTSAWGNRADLTYGTYSQAF